MTDEQTNEGDTEGKENTTAMETEKKDVGKANKELNPNLTEVKEAIAEMRKENDRREQLIAEASLAGINGGGKAEKSKQAQLKEEASKFLSDDE